MPDERWEQRNAALWTKLEDLPEHDFLAAIDVLCAELPGGDPVVAFERGAARDSAGHSDQAVPLYREALGAGLTGLRRRRASIQLASSLRNRDALDETLALLRGELDAPSDGLDDAVAGFLALALADAGREGEARLTSCAPADPAAQAAAGWLTTAPAPRIPK